MIRYDILHVTKMFGKVDITAEGSMVWAIDQGSTEMHFIAQIVTALSASVAAVTVRSRLNSHTISNLEMFHSLTDGSDNT
jgi:hypothetical protein